MRRDCTLLLAAAICVALPTASLAHHSAAAFDQSREVVVAGTITKVAWVNPHVYFSVETVGADGAVVEQEIHAGSVSLLTGLGVSRAVLAVGERVSVRALPARRAGARIVLGFELTTQTGDLFTLESAGRSRAATPSPTVAARGLAGRWLPQRAGFVGYITGVQEHLTAAGQASAADQESYRASVARCEPLVTPPAMLIPMVHDITVGDAAVRIAVDWLNGERIVHLDQSEHPAELTPSLHGHSIGRWDGATLVIDTVGFAPHRSGVIGGVAAGPDKHVVERLSVTDDRLHLKYEVTIEDAEYLAEPFQFTQLWDHRPDVQPSGETCNPEASRRFLELE
jgi:hypothetical protein